MTIAVQYTAVGLLSRLRSVTDSSRQRIDAATASGLVPVRAPQVEAAEDGEEIVLSIARRNGPGVRVLSWFFTLPERKSYRLDRIGALVWRSCDGTATVDQISRRLGTEFGWPEEQARISVLRFLSGLSERRLVGFPAGARDGGQ